MKIGFVSIVGMPNAGKSTLLNSIIKEKVSIVSHHPQTTRDQIKGILTDEDSQIIFLDTPGIYSANNALSTYMNKSLNSSLDDVDAIVYVLAGDKVLKEEEIKLIKGFKNKSKNFILVLNKCDILPSDKILKKIDEISKKCEIFNIVPLSARTTKSVDILLSEIKKNLKDGDMYYPEEYYTDKNERFLIAEIIREKTIQLLSEELPYGIAIDIEKIDESNKLLKVFACIVCEKKPHKQIVIGKGGSMIKKISTDARYEIELLKNKKTYLELFVKVKEDWRKSNYLLKELGYDLKDIE